MSLILFVVTAVLLVAPDSFAFKPSKITVNNSESSGTAKQAEELFHQAQLLADNGDVESANLRLQEAMRLWIQMGESGKAAKAALQLGDLYKQAKKYHHALKYYNQALNIKPLPDAIKTNISNTMGLLYSELAQSELAIPHFLGALNGAQKTKDLRAQIFALTNLANTYHQREEKTEALKYITRAQLLIRQDKAEPDPALLYLLGQINQEEGLMIEARDAFEKALALFTKQQDIPGQTRALCAISNIDLLSSRKDGALKYALQAVELIEPWSKSSTTHAQSTSNRAARWRAWLSRARAERATDQKDRAAISYIRALNHFEGTWWADYIATEAKAIALREEIQAAYREYIDLLIELGRFDEAYENAEASKGRTILNLAEVRRSSPQAIKIDSNKAAEIHELSKSSVRLRTQLVASDISPQQEAELQKELEEVEHKKSELQLEAELAHAKSRIVWSSLANPKGLQERMAKYKMTMAQYSLGENRSFLWLFTKDEVFRETLPPRKEIEEKVKLYLDALATQPHHLYIDKDISKLKKRGEALFSDLFGSLSKHLEPGQRLVVIPDGLLRYLPFGSLVRSGRYLIQDHEISYNPSASMLMLLQDLPKTDDSADTMELFAIGDPVFKSKLTVKDDKKSQNNLKDTTRQALTVRGLDLAPLPRTKDEVQYIAGLFPSNRRKVFTGAESTEDIIKRESKRHYRRWHFATHSLINEKSPLRSAVVLTPSEDEDGLLEASEISNLNLDCDLVVVSACQTGRGQLLSGEGIVGLSRAFLSAGARCVVVSLWNVSDMSTSEVMKSFYKGLTEGMSNASALRNAKLQMISSEKPIRHPYYWSPFVMVGKP